MSNKKSLVEQVTGKKPTAALSAAADYWVKNTEYFESGYFSTAHVVMEAFQAGAQWKRKSIPKKRSKR